MTRPCIALSAAVVVLFTLLSPATSAAQEDPIPRRSPTLESAGGVLTCLSILGYAGAGMAAFNDKTIHEAPGVILLAHGAATALGSVGVPMWIVGSGPAPGAHVADPSRSRSTEMGVAGVVLAGGGVAAFTAGAVSAATDHHRDGELAGLDSGLRLVALTMVAVPAVAFGVPLAVKGFSAVGSEPSAAARSSLEVAVTAGPGTIGVQGRW